MKMDGLTACIVESGISGAVKGYCANKGYEIQSQDLNNLITKVPIIASATMGGLVGIVAGASLPLPVIGPLASCSTGAAAGGLASALTMGAGYGAGYLVGYL